MSRNVSCVCFFVRVIVQDYFKKLTNCLNEGLNHEFVSKRIYLDSSIQTWSLHMTLSCLTLNSTIILASLLILRIPQLLLYQNWQLSFYISLINYYFLLRNPKNLDNFYCTLNHPFIHCFISLTQFSKLISTTSSMFFFEFHLQMISNLFMHRCNYIYYW